MCGLGGKVKNPVPEDQVFKVGKKLDHITKFSKLKRICSVQFRRPFTRNGRHDGATHIAHPARLVSHGSLKIDLHSGQRVLNLIGANSEALFRRLKIKFLHFQIKNFLAKPGNYE